MEPAPLPPGALTNGSKGLVGHASGTAIESEDTLGFSVLHGVRPMIATLALEQADEAYIRMLGGDARFRVVLTVHSS